MPRDTIITPNTALPLSVVVVIVAFCCAGVGLFWSIKSDISSLRESVVTKDQVKEWREDFQEANPHLRVPRFPTSPGDSKVRPSVIGQVNEPAGVEMMQ